MSFDRFMELKYQFMGAFQFILIGCEYEIGK